MSHSSEKTEQRKSRFARSAIEPMQEMEKEHLATIQRELVTEIQATAKSAPSISGDSVDEDEDSDDPEMGGLGRPKRRATRLLHSL